MGAAVAKVLNKKAVAKQRLLKVKVEKPPNPPVKSDNDTDAETALTHVRELPAIDDGTQKDCDLPDNHLSISDVLSSVNTPRQRDWLVYLEKSWIMISGWSQKVMVSYTFGMELITPSAIPGHVVNHKHARWVQCSQNMSHLMLMRQAFVKAA